jgi:xylulokinase
MDTQGAVVGEAAAACHVSHPQPGWSEQNPEDWITACDTAVMALRQDHPKSFAALRAIGLSGHMHGATLLDASDHVLRPCILWNDTRATAEAADLDQLPDVRRISGNIVFPGFTAPKLVWVRNHEPEVFDQIAKVLLPKDYLRFCLTGEMVSDMSDSAGTSWLDVGQRRWSETLLEASQMRADQMPRLIEGSEVSGELRVTLREKWGLNRSVIVAGGGGDNAAAACGVGCLKAGHGFVSLGTSGVLLAASKSFAPAPEQAVHTFCHAVPERWFQMGVSLAATDSLNWLARQLGQTPAELATALPDQNSGPGRPLFLPYLSGERTPHNDSRMRGAFIGLDIADDPRRLTAAVMEGVSFALRDCLEALKSAGTSLEHTIAIGGGTRSEFWLRTLATTLNIPLHIPAKGEFGAAMGAARLAMIAATGSDPSDVIHPPDIKRTVMPDQTHQAAYEDKYATYKALYAQLKSLPGL